MRPDAEKILKPGSDPVAVYPALAAPRDAMVVRQDRRTSSMHEIRTIRRQAASTPAYSPMPIRRTSGRASSMPLVKLNPLRYVGFIPIRLIKTIPRLAVR